MTEPRKLTKADVPPSPWFDGTSAVRASLRDADAERSSRLAALPPTLLYLLVGLMYGLLASLSAGDFSQIRSAAAAVVPEASAGQLDLLALALTLAYALVWHVVGSRGAAARAAVLAAPGDAGRPLLRGFGWAGLFHATLGTTALVGIALSRADVLARLSGDIAARRVVSDALGAVDVAAVADARGRAVTDAFWPDLRWGLVVLGLLAAAALLVGFLSGPMKRAAGLAMAERSIMRRRLGLSKVEARESAARSELVSRIEGRARVVELAGMQDREDRELPHRFDAAKERFRVALAVRLSDPEATTVLVDTDGRLGSER
jgi:hypothetical protein